MVANLERLLVARNQVEAVADRHANEAVDDGRRRRTGQPEAQRREGHDEQRQG